MSDFPISAAESTSASLLYGLLGVYVALAAVAIVYWLNRRVRQRRRQHLRQRPSSVVHAATALDSVAIERIESELREVTESLVGLKAELVCWRDATGQSAAEIKSLAADLEAVKTRLSAIEDRPATWDDSGEGETGRHVIALFGEPDAHGDSGEWRADGARAEPPCPFRAQGMIHDQARGWVYAEAPENGDDLTEIWGIGPGYEKRLQQSGVHRFCQIAAWTDVTIDYFDDLFSFKGRIRRENWVGQADRMSVSDAA